MRKCLILLLFGSEFQNAIALKILLTGIFVQTIFGLGSSTLSMSGNTAFNLINVSIALILNIVLNFILIPQYGIIGAAYATLFVIIFINTLKLILVAVNFNIYPYSPETIKIAFAIAIAYLFANYIKLDFNSFINILIRSSLIVLIYSILCYFLGLTGEITNQIKKSLKL